MNSIERELDRVLTLLRNKIRERGFTQLEVQEALGWGRSYISQLLTKQKSLRVEQVLLILSVIKVSPPDFFGELYPLSPDAAGSRHGYGSPVQGRAPYNPSVIAEAGASDGLAGDWARSFRELREMTRGLIRILVAKKVVDVDELSSVGEASETGSMLSELAKD